jgi:hypothetical protein
MDNAPLAGHETREEWWSVKDVAAFLGIKQSSAKVWMWRNNVRRCKGNIRLTHKSWVEACLVNGKRPDRKKRVTRNVLGQPVDSSGNPINLNQERESNESNYAPKVG